MSASISVVEPHALTCPACGQAFTPPVTLVLDAREQPERAAQLLAGELDQLVCPHCGATHTAQAPLLLHDAAGQYVLFAPTPGFTEAQIREEARDLVARLTSALPEERQLPYLSDLSVSDDRDGLRRAYARRARRAAARAGASSDVAKDVRVGHTATPPPTDVRAGSPPPSTAATYIPPPTAATPYIPPPTPPPTPPLPPDAIDALLAADSPAEAQDIVRAHPALLHVEADAALNRLASDALRRGDEPMAHALGVARSLLSDLRSGRAIEVPLADPPDDDEPATLPAAALEALLRADTPDQLRTAVADYPVLLDLPADEALYVLGETAAIEGNERAASDLESRRERLLSLRVELVNRETFRRAAQALVRAPDAAACEAVIAEFPGLLATEAGPALLALADSARAQGREGIAELLVERADLLRTVRAGLEGT